MQHKNYSEVRKIQRESYSQARNIKSEIRHRDFARERSRDDAKSRHSIVSMKSNKSGPVIFGGNALLKKKAEG